MIPSVHRRLLTRLAVIGIIILCAGVCRAAVSGTVTLNNGGATMSADGLDFTIGGYTLQPNAAGDTLTVSGTNALLVQHAADTNNTSICSGFANRRRFPGMRLGGVTFLEDR